MTRRGKGIILIILIILIALVLLITYVYLSGSKNFEILDINEISSINDSALRIVIKTTEECNKIDMKAIFKTYCYFIIAHESGYFYGNTICEKFNERFIGGCYRGYGKRIGEEYGSDLTTIQNKCSKLSLSSLNGFNNSCLLGAAMPIGQESANHIETEQCKKIEQQNIKKTCYEHIGRALAEKNKEQSLCEKIENKESCLTGFSYGLYKKGQKEEALKICNQLTEENAKQCYNNIGEVSIIYYNKTINEAFQECEKYSYPENCKRGAIAGLSGKLFRKNQLFT